MDASDGVTDPHGSYDGFESQLPPTATPANFDRHTGAFQMTTPVNPSQPLFFSIPLPNQVITQPQETLIFNPLTNQKLRILLVDGDMDLTGSEMVSSEHAVRDSALSKRVADKAREVFGQKYVNKEFHRKICNRNPQPGDYEVLCVAYDKVESSANNEYRDWIRTLVKASYLQTPEKEEKVKRRGMKIISDDLFDLIRSSRKRMRDRRSQRNIRYREEESARQQETQEINQDSVVQRSSSSMVSTFAHPGTFQQQSHSLSFTSSSRDPSTFQSVDEQSDSDSEGSFA